MICTGVQGETALDFYLNLSSRGEERSCCGPLVYLKLSEPTARIILYALSEIDMEECIASAYITKVSEDIGLFGSCFAHWLDIVALMGEIGHQSERPDYVMISNKIFEKICNAAGWDWKELDNYLESMGMNDDD